MILAGDIGGTNVNLALIEAKDGGLRLLLDGHYRTREESSLLGPLARFLEGVRALPGSPQPTRCCVSGAGPVVNNRIELTNAPWGIDGPEIERRFGIPTRLVNDFTALSYGVLLLDPRDPAEVSRLPHTDGSDPVPEAAGLKLVVGAGTGLGVGFIVNDGGRPRAYPSEGGHITLPVFDAESRELQTWLEGRYGFVPGAEAAVSGQGIANIHDFLRSRQGGETGFLDAPAAERPLRISQAAATGEPLALAAMELFVRLYARVCADLSAAFIPSGGLYLAGGIAAKNEGLFLGDQRFMASFERSYREHIRAILGRVPVMIVKDYAISLYGAANAALWLA